MAKNKNQNQNQAQADEEEVVETGAEGTEELGDSVEKTENADKIEDASDKAAESEANAEEQSAGEVVNDAAAGDENIAAVEEPQADEEEVPGYDVHRRVADTAASLENVPGAQESHWALHKLETLLGELKGALPAAIDAIGELDNDLACTLLNLKSVL